MMSNLIKTNLYRYENRKDLDVILKTQLSEDVYKKTKDFVEKECI